MDGNLKKLTSLVLRTIQLVAELQIIRRVGEDHIHRVGGERVEDFDAVAAQDLVERESHFNQLCSICLACSAK